MRTPAKVLMVAGNLLECPCLGYSKESKVRAVGGEVLSSPPVWGLFVCLAPGGPTGRARNEVSTHWGGVLGGSLPPGPVHCPSSHDQ